MLRDVDGLSMIGYGLCDIGLWILVAEGRLRFA